MTILELFLKFLKRLAPDREFNAVIKATANIAFPRGKEQIKEESEVIYAALNRKIPIDDVERILMRTKPLFYLRNFKRDGDETVEISEAIQNSTKFQLELSDLNIIYRFYNNYFNFRSKVANERHSNPGIDCNSLSPSEDVDLIVNLSDCNGKFWGSVKFSEAECLWIAKPGDGGGLYATMLFLALTSARKKLSPDDKDQFSRWAGLPRGTWTERHYSEFAFSCVKWLSIADDEIRYNENLKKVKEWLAQSGECSSLNLDFNSAMRAVFSRMFQNN